MSCCGQRRQAHKAWLVSRPVHLRFLGEGKIQVKGNATGRCYEFSEMTREIEVDPRDATGLLQGRSFFVVSESTPQQVE